MVRKYKVRYEVLRNGATLTELKQAGTVTVDCEAFGDIKTSMAGIFQENEEVNWLTDEIKPYQIIDGTEYPVGVFQVGTVTKRTDRNGEKTVSIEAYDRGIKLLQTKTENILHLSKGTNYVLAVEQMMTQAGVPLYLATKTDEVLATDREDWDPGTSYMEIINQLLQEINYGKVWFNTEGIAIVRPEREPTAENIDHEYGMTDQVKVLKRQSSTETDAYNAPNVFVAICSNPDLSASLIAKAVNNNPLSALSVENRGRRITKVMQVNNAPNLEALQETVNRICGESMLSSEMVTIKTANVPGHNVLDTVAIVHPDIQGIFQETGWHIILDNGEEMLHNLRRSIII